MDVFIIFEKNVSHLIGMPFLAVGKLAVIRDILLTTQLLSFTVHVAEIDGVSVTGERGGGAAFRGRGVRHTGRGLISHHVLAFVVTALVHRAHHLKSLDRIANVAVPVVHSRRVNGLRSGRRLVPRFRDSIRLHRRVDRQTSGHASETVLMIQERGRIDRSGDYASSGDRALQDRSSGQLATLFAHRLPQPRLFRVVHVICGTGERLR